MNHSPVSDKSVVACVKCDSTDGWDGPTYVGWNSFHYDNDRTMSTQWCEQLEFICRNCGYKRHEPTKDTPPQLAVEIVVESSANTPWWRRWL